MVFRVIFPVWIFLCEGVSDKIILLFEFSLLFSAIIDKSDDVLDYDSQDLKGGQKQLLVEAIHLMKARIF